MHIALERLQKNFATIAKKTKMMINAVMENSETLEIYPGVMMTSLFKTMSAKELFDLINAKIIYIKTNGNFTTLSLFQRKWWMNIFLMN